MLNKITFLKISIALLMLSFLIQVITVVCIMFMRDILMRMKVFHAVFEVHEYNGLILIGLVLVHLFFNWGWVKSNFLKQRRGA